MDANGLRFWMLASAADWQLGVPPGTAPTVAASGVEYDDDMRVLRLARVRSEPSFGESRGAAVSALGIPAVARDRHGTRAWWDPASERILAAAPGEAGVAIETPPGARAPSDLAMGYDDVLYVARDGAVFLIDRRARWPMNRVARPPFEAHALTADPAGGVWVLDRTRAGVARLAGSPLRARPWVGHAPGTFRPCEENPDPPRLVVPDRPVLPPGEEAIALACSPTGRLALLAWRSGADARVHLVAPDGRLLQTRTLRGVRHPHSIGWVDAKAFAVLLPGVAEALVYPAEGTGDVLPAGEYRPLVGALPGPLSAGVGGPPHYPVAGGTRVLHALSLPAYARTGSAANFTRDAEGIWRVVPIDSGVPGTEWHRLCIEVSVPEGCGVVVHLAAGNQEAPPEAGEGWHPHAIGTVPEGTVPAHAPRAAWSPQASELPFHPGLLPCPSEPGRAGLFSVLIQRSGLRVRTLAGRWLWVRVSLHGDGRSSPALAAIRAYASRFSYRDRYLPELYHESVFGPDADAAGSATAADFLGRMLDNFEGLLTPLEDRIAQAWLLTDAGGTPDEALPWLGSWIGLAFDPGLAPAIRREMLEAAPWLFRMHGTLGGLAAALEVATGGRIVHGGTLAADRNPPVPGRLALASADGTSRSVMVLQVAAPASGSANVVMAGGAVTGGAVVLVENFRLRRTFATILGADLADADDALTAGISVSGNSFVGDTLFLGDAARREFLAVFDADLPVSGAEARAIAALHDRLAHRVTVLVHDPEGTLDLGQLRRVAGQASPAHLDVRVVRARFPFMAGVASLVGVDSYLAAAPPVRPVRVDASRIGAGDVLAGTGALDPRLAGAAAVLPDLPPVADPGPDRRVEFGASFVLDGSRSRAAPGRRIENYAWTLRAGP